MMVLNFKQKTPVSIFLADTVYRMTSCLQVHIKLKKGPSSARYLILIICMNLYSFFLRGSISALIQIIFLTQLIWKIVKSRIRDKLIGIPDPWILFCSGFSKK